jgi:hypothetical protein
MLGCDGIVVVGDTWQYVEPGGRPWYGYHSSKFRVSEDKRIAVAGAVDMDASFAVADGIIQARPQGRSEILAIGNQFAANKDSHCLIALCDPWPCLYRFIHAKDGRSSCDEVIGCIPIGDQWNVAYYWAMRHHSNSLSCQQLARLGALVVVSGGHISSGTIGGLEGFTCTTAGIRVWNRTESDTLKSDIENLENGFKASILGP